MNLTSQQANAITSAVWLVGIGTLIVTGWWWPGVLFLIGALAIAQGLVDGRGCYAFQGSLWFLGFGVWALSGYNILVLFCLFAASGLLGAFVKPQGTAKKPVVDNYLE